MKLSIAEILNDNLLAEACKKASSQTSASGDLVYLCLKIDSKNFHEHVKFEKNNYDILEIRRQIFDLINKKMGIEPKTFRITASICILLSCKMIVDSIIS